MLQVKQWLYVLRKRFSHTNNVTQSAPLPGRSGPGEMLRRITSFSLLHLGMRKKDALNDRACTAQLNQSIEVIHWDQYYRSSLTVVAC